MDCRTAEELLLDEEDPSTGRLAPGELADHLVGCEACQRFAGELDRLEASWRAIPLPVGVEAARDAFLEGFRKAAVSPAGVARRRPIPARWLVAASILVALVVGGGLVAMPRRAVASPDVVERLIDWNLSLAHAPSAGERGRIYAGHASDFADEVGRAALPAEDRELVRSLLEKAPELVREPDALVEADRFDDLAEKLLARMNRAARGGDTGRLDQSAALYRRVAELGIGSKLEVLEASGSLEFARQRRLERLILQDAGRMHTLVELLERVPDSSRKQIKRALGIKRRPRKAPVTGPSPAETRKGRARKGAEPAPTPAGEISP